MNHDSQKDDSTNIKTAFFLNLGFTILEIFGGLWTNSLAILSDAVHDLGDSLSLGLAWFLGHYARRERDRRFSYGYRTSTHHTHIWSLDGEHHVLTTHVVVSDALSREQVRNVKQQVKHVLETYKLSHLTVEIEYGDSDCGMRE